MGNGCIIGKLPNSMLKPTHTQTSFLLSTKRLFELNMIVRAKTITVNRKRQSPMVKEKIKLSKH